MADTQETPEQAKARKREEHRIRAVKEFVSTEQTYVSGLSTLKEIYLVPLRMVAEAAQAAKKQASSSSKSKKVGASGGNIVEVDVLDQVFCNIETIVHEHKKFCEALEALEDAANSPDFGEIVKKTMKRLKGLYTRYVNHFDESDKVLNNEMKSNENFSRYVQVCRTNPDAKGLDLRSFLIMPVQRPPRYRLLLEDIIKHLPEGSGDLASLNEALDNVKEMACAINENKRQTDNLDDLKKLKSRFAPTQTTKLEGDLVALDRAFLLEGPAGLVVGSKVQSSAQPHHLLLFSDMLMYTIETRSGLDVIGYCEFRKCRIYDCIDSSGFSNSIGLRDQNEFGRLFVFPSAEEKSKWIQKIRAAEKEIPLEIPSTSAFSISKIRTRGHHVKERIERLKNPEKFTKFRQKDGAAPKKYISIDQNGLVIQWGDNGKKPKHKAPLEEVQFVRSGITSPVFFRGGEQLPPEFLCFSLYMKDRSLDFAVESPDSLLDWYLGLQYQLATLTVVDNFLMTEPELIDHLRQYIPE